MLDRLKPAARARSAVAELSAALADARKAPRRVLVGETCGVVLLFTGGVLLRPELVDVGLLEAWLFSLYAAVLVLARRRWPLAALLASSVLAVTDHIVLLFPHVVIAFSAGRREPRASRLWGFLTLTAAAEFVLAFLVMQVPLTGVEASSILLSVLLMLLLPAVSGALLGQRQPLGRLLRERNEFLERTQELTAARARAAERTSIAGEMHDMLGHRLSMLSLHAGALELSAAKAAPEVGEQAGFVRTTAGEALDELRGILTVLRSDEHEELDQYSGCRNGVERLVAESSTAGMDVELRWDGPDLEDADAQVRHAVHRIVREAVTNAHKHAPGSAVRVAVTVEDRVLIRIANDAGSEPAGTVPGLRSGLAGLEERARVLGGRLTGAPDADRGFVVSADLPTQAHPDSAAPQLQPPEWSADILTAPRAFGAGCLLLLVVSLLLMLLGALCVALLGGPIRLSP